MNDILMFPILEFTQNDTTREMTYYRHSSDGMTLRDYFAAKAMEGELATMGDSNGIDIDVCDSVLENTCKHWYRIADAMLKARNK